MSKKYDEYLKTDYWKAVSDAVKKRAGYRCALCNSQHDLCAHHRTYEHRGRELDFLDDLTCLCRRCHEIFHGRVKPAHIQGDVRPHKADRWKSCVDHIQVSQDMPPGNDPIVLTHDLVQRCRNARGAFTNAAIVPLGVKPPLTRGWAHALVGKTVTREAYRQALEGRYIYGLKIISGNPAMPSS